MHSPIAPIEAVSGIRAAASAAVAPAPATGSADPAAVSAFQKALQAPAGPHADTSVKAPPTHRYHAASSAAPSDTAHTGSDLMRWAEQTQREFASSMQTTLPPAGSDLGAMLQDLQRVTMTCITVSLCKNVADQVIQAGQTLLRQQN